MDTPQIIYTLPPSVLDQLKTLVDQKKELAEAGAPHNWVDAYQLVYDTIKNDPGVPQGVKNWLSIAISVNGGDPQNLVYQYVSNETILSANEVRGTTGAPLMDQTEFLVGSNKLAESIFDRIVGYTDTNTGTFVSGTGGLPVAETLVTRDANSIILYFGIQMNGWAGNTPYGIGDGFLGVDTTTFRASQDGTIFRHFVQALAIAIEKTHAAGVSYSDIYLRQYGPNMVKYAQQVSPAYADYLRTVSNGEFSYEVTTPAADSPIETSETTIDGIWSVTTYGNGNVYKTRVGGDPTFAWDSSATLRNADGSLTTYNMDSRTGRMQQIDPDGKNTYFTPKPNNGLQIETWDDYGNVISDIYAHLPPEEEPVYIPVVTPITSNGTETNSIDVHVNPDPLLSHPDVPDPTSGGPSAEDTSALINTGTYGVNGVGNVNTATGNEQAANSIVSNDFQPGANAILPDLGTSLDNYYASDLLTQAMAAAQTNIEASGSITSIPVDPLILDLNGDGVKLTSFADAPVLFDIDHDGGSKEVTGWVSSQDGIVVMDLNGNGQIDDISETMSEYFNGAVGVNGEAGTKPYANGFDALKSLDCNADNKFTSADAAWNSVKVWQDANHDGKTDAGELKTLTELGITSINLAATAQSGLVSGGNEVLATGTFVQNGVTKEALAAEFIANSTGNTAILGATGTTVNAEDGQSTYVSSVNTGETIDVVQKGVKNAYGNSGNDTLIGDANANWLVGGQGSDTFNAGAGDDMLIIDANDLQQNIHAGSGFDMVQVVGDAGVTLNLDDAEVEVAVGGRGNDTLAGGGHSSVFIRAGDGDDIVIGGAANDALSGENGNDMIDGGSGNDIIRGGTGQDQLAGGIGDDIVYGGQDDDRIFGGAGNDVLKGEQGDDVIDGGDGVDIAEYSGSFADYRITRISDASYRIVDTRAGSDGADTLTNIEKLNFSDLSSVDITLDNPMPVRDTVTINASGQALSRNTPQLIASSQLLANDRDWQGDALHITEVLEAIGGTVSLTASGDVLFVPTPGFTGIMSFKYKVADADGTVGATAIDLATGQSAQMKAAVYLSTPDLPVDPLLPQQWYLTDANILPVWDDYTGKGVSIAQFEPGMPFSTGSQIFDYRHSDLQDNVDPNWIGDPDSDIPQSFSEHATLVAGVIAAERNGEGVVGVAYDAKLSGHYFQGNGLEIEEMNQELTDTLAQYKNYDVVNNSWGSSDAFNLNVTPIGALETGLGDAVRDGRHGLGTAIVFAAGNDRTSGGNANYNALINNRAVITVGAINAPGDIGTLQLGQKPFSDPGANILVSAPGSNISSTGQTLIGKDGTVFGADDKTTQGTSFATPIVSGIIALMLEANPNLGYRDIQTILAMSATKFDDPNGTDWSYNGAKNWNGGGMHASSDYGFGKVDALAAVRLAETWGETNTYNGQGELSASLDVNRAIPDGAGSLTSSLTLASGMEVEHAQVSLSLDHANWGDLIVTLISPSGTRSVLMNRPGKAPGSDASDTGDAGTVSLNFSFGSTHLLGEDSGGTWTLQVTDAATGNTGTLNNWTLDLYGKSADSDDIYVYTNEYAATAQGDASRRTLVDSDGGSDTINAAAMSGNNTINLNAGAQSSLNGQSMVVATGTSIEQAIGGDGNDVLIGNALDNRLVGGRGNDSLSGGDGNDIVDGGSGTDSLAGGAGQDLFVIGKETNGVDTVTDFNFTNEKIALTGFGHATFENLVVTQEGANTRVSLGDGQSVLLLNMTAANFSRSNVIFIERENISGFTIGSNAADPEMVGSGFAQHLYLGEGGDDRIFGGQGADEIHGGDGNDTLVGEPTNATTTSAGNTILGGGDVIYGDAGDDILLGGVQNDVLRGGAGNDYVQGDAGDDTIYVEGGEDRYLGLYGYYGNAGADRFVVEQDSGGGIGLLRNFIGDFDVSQAGEKIDLSELSNVRSFSDLRFGTIFVDGTQFTRVYVGGASSSQYITLAGVTQSQLSADNFIFSTTAITGTGQADTLSGNAGGNIIDGSSGADVMTGRTGDDTYIVDNAGDTVIELPDGGFDTIRASVSYTLAENVENLTLAGTAAIYGTGNDSANRIVGNSADNVLDGKGGIDVLVGGAGNDIYVVDSQADTIIEQVGEGRDTIRTSVSYVLGKNIEDLTLTGSSAVNATGNELSNTLIGNVAENILDGAQGADLMSGGQGDDTYYVDNAGDTVTENIGEGTDTVIASVNYTLASNVENLILAYGVTNGTGNSLNNQLKGNSSANTLVGGEGNDTLDGGAGADTLIGGSGDDTYFIDNADVIVEAAGEGNDTVVTSSAIDLNALANIENVQLTGASSVNVTGNNADNRLLGNTGANILTGGAGNDLLDGGAGADRLVGGSGNDKYVVDDAGDIVVENSGEGIDTIVSSFNVDLNTLSGGNLENAMLNGTGNLNLTGNAADNVLQGNSGNNALLGGAGNDTLDGGIGADTMAGGTGNDTYYVNDASDQVTEFAGEGTDSIFSSVNYALGTNQENLTLTGHVGVNATGNASDNVITGNDADNILTGGLGNDTYHFDIDSGNDSIVDIDSTANNFDRVIMGAGIDPDDIAVQRISTQLILHIGATGQTLSILWAPEQGKAIESIEFADGTVWDAAILQSKADFAPQVDAPLVDQAAIENQAFIFTIPSNTFSDPDIGDSLTFSAVLANGDPLPAWLTFDPVTQSFSGTPANEDVGSVAIKVIAQDNRGVQCFDAFQIVVSNVNNAPTVAHALTGQTVSEGIVFSLAIPSNTFSDVDVGDSLSYSILMSDGGSLPSWLAFDASAGTFSGMAPYSAVGNYSLQVIATDVTGAHVSSDFILSVNAQAATIVGTTSGESLVGTAGADIIDGRAGDDFMAGGIGNDTYIFNRGSGQDQIDDEDITSGNVDRIRFGSNIATTDITVTRTEYDLLLKINGTGDQITLVGWFLDDRYKIEQLEFSDGTIWTANDLLPKITSATESSDQIIGTAGADILSGLGGRDLIKGMGGDDVIDGGAGNDHLEGGLGNDVFLFGRGSGQDIIANDTSGYSHNQTVGLVDTLRFAPGIASSDIEVTRDDTSLFLQIKGTHDRVELEAWFNSQYLAQTQRVEFADGTVWNAAALTAMVSGPTDGDDYFDGTSGADTYYGLGGNDSLTGGSGNDVLDGGAGDDMLDGGAGNDTYYFGNGYGRDAISDFDFSANTDRIVMRPGVSPNDVQVSRNESDLFLSLNGGADRLTVYGWFSDSFDQVERVEFSDGTVWDVNTIFAKLPGATNGKDVLQAATMGGSLAGLAGDDILIGDRGADTLDGGSGNDVLNGGSGDDTYIFNRGYGQDLISESSSDPADSILFGAGIAATDVKLDRDGTDLVLSIIGTTDSLRIEDWFFSGTSYRVEQIKFQDGTIWSMNTVTSKLALPTSGDDTLVGTTASETINGLAGNDRIFGEDGSDVLDGGTGDDVLFGGDGNDTYIFGNGYGHDTVSYVRTYDMQGDKVLFSAGVSATGVTVTRSETDLYLSLNGGTDRLTIEGWFGNSSHPLLQFADGTVWGDGDIASRLPGISGLADFYSGGSGADNIDGLGGDDFLQGGGGDDFIAGGAGNDILNGQAGSDVFLFERNGGRDVVIASTFSSVNGINDSDTVRFAETISADDIVVSRNENNLYLSIKGTADRITIQDWFGGDGSNIDQVEFANGDSWDRDALTDLAGDWPQGPKLVSVLTDQNATQGMLFTQSLPSNLFTDDDLLLSYSATLADGTPLPAWITFDPQTQTFSGVPGGGDVGDFSFKITATNSFGASTSEIFDISVANINDAPMIAGAISNLTTAEDVLFSYTIPSDAFIDLDFGDHLSFDATLSNGAALPAWLSFDAESKTFSGTPGNDDVGNVSIKVTVTDESGARVSEVFDIAVTNVNDAPIIAGPITDQYVKEQKAFNFQIPAGTFADADNDSLSLSFSTTDGVALPSWISYDAATQTLSGTPNVGDAGTFPIFVTATDPSGASVVASFNIAVAANRAPVVIQTVGNQTGKEGEAFSFELSPTMFADADIGDTLSISATLADGSPLPSWLHFDALTRTFSGVPGDNDVGQKNLKIIATDSAGASVFSTFTIDISNVNDIPTGAVIVAGFLTQGETLTVVNSLNDADGVGPVTYQWYADGTAIGGAATDSFVLTQDQVGKAITVKASYTDGYGTAESVVSAATSTVANVNDSPTGIVTITGAAEQGQILTVSNTLSDADGLGAITYQWYADEVAINGATAGTLTLTQDQVGKAITVKAGYTDSFGTVESVASTATDVVDNTNDAPTGTVTISGVAAQGQILTVADTLMDADGLGTISYQWYADAVAIDGATANTLMLSQDQVGKAITVTAGYTDAFGTIESVSSDATTAVGNINDAPTGSVTITGSVEQGETLTALDTLDDADGMGVISYQWFADGVAISGATSDSLVLSQGQVGKSISVTASYTDNFGGVESVTSTATAPVDNVNDAPAGSVTIVGTAAQGHTLTIANTLSDLDGLGDIVYQWESSTDGINWTAIDGATASSFTLTADQMGEQIHVTASYTDGYLNPESVTSAATDAVTFGDVAPVVAIPLSNQVIVAGSPFNYIVPANAFQDEDPGDTLTYQAKLADGSALPSWLTFNATTRTFSGTSSAAGTISVQVIATDSANESVSNTFTLVTQAAGQALTGTPDADILMGNGSANTLNGLAGDDVLNGGAGNDTMIGGTGNDTYIVDATGDIVTETSTDPNEIDTVQSSVTYTLGANVENLTLTGATAINGTGNALDNVLTGNAAANTLNGGAGADTMAGGLGNDIYVVDNVDDIVIETSSVATEIDTVQSSVTYTLSANVENLTLTGSDDINGTGNAWANMLTGNSAANVLDGGTGADTMTGGTGNDTYVVDNAGDVVTETSTSSTEIDTVLSSINYTLGTNVENLTLTGISNINATGNTAKNTLTGNTANNILNGGIGADTMIGDLGNDTYVVDNVGDIVIETSTLATEIDTVQSSVTYTLSDNVENLVLTGTTAINGTGNDVKNTMTGNDAANILDGGLGADRMTGGLGNDTYIVDNTGDVVVETSTLATEIDNVQSSVSYTLGANVENLTLTGTAAINGTGNALNNTLTGNAAANVLNGGAGADKMIGGLGNDTYVVDDVGDIVSETTVDVTEIDTVQSSITYTLGANLDNLTLTGTATINGTGNTLNNTLTGNAADNVLNGGAGADIMKGGLGNDTYIVDNIGDVVTETSTLATEIDSVQSGVTFALSANVENLTLTGTAAIDGTGNSLANTLVGNSGANLLNGGAGADTMTGGTGNDTYVVDNVGDVVTETSTSATEIDTVQSSIAYTLGANLENLVLTGSAAINGTGNSLKNSLTGNSGANVLDGGTGADTMTGGSGNDTYIVDNVGDVIVETSTSASEIDSVQSSVSYTLSANVENLTLTGSSAINATGNASKNVLTGNGAANILDGGTGADTMTGGLGNDTYVVDNTGDVIVETSTLATEIDTVQSSITYTLGANLENLVLTGTANINGTGNDVKNTMTGNDGANILDGGIGADKMTGGLGNDTYIVDNTGDVVVETSTLATEIDTVQSSVTYTLGANVENLTLTGTTAINGTGNALNNVLTGNAAANILNGGAGADRMVGGLGNDTYVVDDIGDVVSETTVDVTEIDTVQASITYTLGTNLDNLTLTGTDDINGTGNTLNNTLTGNAADNILNGGTGTDTMKGGLGNDIYIVDNVGDVVTETSTLATEIDSVQSSVTFTLSANVENLTLTGTAAINGTGNGSANTLIGNSAANILNGGAGDDTLNGGAGADTLIGSTGNDTYVVDNTGDVVTETSTIVTEIDTVQSSVTYTLGANLENLTLTGASAISGTGNALINVLTGNAANNTLNGGAGADTMIGGLGNDTYVVDDIGDIVIETSTLETEIDTVQASVSYILSDNIENLTLTGSATANGTGNALNNTLTGNTVANVLDGGGGADRMVGGTGNDTYIVDDIGDVVVETSTSATEIDTVQSSVSYALSSNVENLILTGSDAINATGNTLKNMLTGNGGDNVLDGGAGIDTMAGGLGNDTYVVDNVGDIVTENADEGIDTVVAALNYTLGANLENLTLTGAAGINATGNNLDNVLTGNSADNSLQGGAGNDTLIGGAGNDTLIGDVGNDTYVFNLGDGVDIISDHDAIVGNVDNLVFGEGITQQDLKLIRAGDNLQINILGTSDQITILNWYLGATYQIEKIQTSDGAILVNTDVDGIIEAAGGYDDVIMGNDQDNVLDGGLGADTMIGGAGNDTYYVDNVGDVVVEAAGEGMDTVISTVDYVFTDNVEIARLYGTGLHATGNDLGNGIYAQGSGFTLSGGAGDDHLEADGQGDTLIGGTGNDSYFVYSEDELVIETSTDPSEIDVVNSYVANYTLTENVENLEIENYGGVSTGIGNSLDNLMEVSFTQAYDTYLYGEGGNDRLIGSNGNDTLDGGDGDDILTGNRGTDTLIGGNGSDDYRVGFSSSLSYATTIIQNDSIAGDVDTVEIAAASQNQLWMRHVGNDLEIDQMGTDNTILMKDWYLGSQYQVKRITTYDDFRTMLNTDVEQLVQAMASFGPTIPSGTTWPTGPSPTGQVLVAVSH